MKVIGYLALLLAITASASVCDNTECEPYSICVETTDDAGIQTATCNCPEICPDIFEPVCSNAFVTFSNACELYKVRCSRNLMTLAVDHSGECDACDSVSCIETYEPVCANGATYSNVCLMHIAECQANQVFAYTVGECVVEEVDVCAHNDCAPFAMCVPEPKECFTTPCPQYKCECPENCIETYEPVCTNAFVTFNNECEMQRAACNLNLPNLSIKSQGECGGCGFRCSDEYAPVCANGVTFQNECMMMLEECSQNQVFAFTAGTCECLSNDCAPFATCVPEPKECFTTPCPQYKCECPEVCADIFEPVCSNALVTFNNECELQRAACNLNLPGLAVVSQEECSVSCDDIVCTDDYSPVCANGITFQNQCFLKQQQCKSNTVFAFSEGECDLCADADCGPFATCVPEPKECFTTPCPQYKCECPEVCADIFEPVCSNAMVTFNNECELQRAACNLNLVSLAVDHTGECDACDTIVCIESYEPVCANGRTFSNLCAMTIEECQTGEVFVYTAGECVTEEEPCPEFCAEIYQPVCSSAMVTFANECELNRVKCALNLPSLAKIADGECDACDTIVCIDSYEPVCANGQTFSNACAMMIAECQAGEVFVATAGECVTEEPCPEFCTQVYEPVCSSAMVTFANECELNRIKCALNLPSLVKTADGECDACDSIVCIDSYEPVCANGQTFSNECAMMIAECQAGEVFVATAGECVTEEPCPEFCTEVYEPVCSSAMVTFTNECELNRIKCALNLPSLIKTADGECDSCDSIVCIDSYEPVCANGQTFSNECAMMIAECQAGEVFVATAGECITEEPCPEACTKNYAPVCSSAMVTFANECELNRVKCALNLPSLVKTADGECDACDTIVCIDSYEPVCANGQTFSNECAMMIAECQAGEVFVATAGECVTEEPCPEFCAEIYQPVCGNNFFTFANECELKRAKCQFNLPNLAVSYDGECGDCGVLDCANIYEPVCAEGVTYSNLCNMQVAQCFKHHLSSYTSGVCEDVPAPCAQQCTQVYDPVCSNRGITYGNDCLLSVAACNSQIAITAIFKGECFTFPKWNAIKKFDTDKDGVNIDEYIAAISATYPDVPVDNIRASFAALDSNGDGDLTQDEYTEAVIAQQGSSEPEPANPLSMATIAGIVVGCVALVAVLAAIGYQYRARRVAQPKGERLIESIDVYE